MTMRSMQCAILGTGLLSLCLTGCLVTRSDLRGDREPEGRKSQETVTVMQKEKAETNSRYSDLESSIREMNGRVEVVENRVSQNDQNAGKVQRQQEEQLNETNKKVQLLQEELTKMEAQIQLLNDQVANSHRPVEEASDEKPASKVEKKTKFDIGEDYFLKKEWKKAILNYQKYRDDSPKAKMVNEATYKIGVCFQELGMKDEAKSFYEELVAKAPGSPEARRAKIRLKKLK